jgi:hypothetical protein
MLNLQSLSVGQRFAITGAIILAVLLGLALYGYLTGAWEEEEDATAGYALQSAVTHPLHDMCVTDDETREKVRNIMLEAFDSTLKQHLSNMYLVWMRDETGQPERAALGARQGIAAYVRARETAMKWDPPHCK